ncbi:DsrE family protein [Desulforhopalus singaporensis]|uniref:Intracellular sulfur oxidation protein, DsrE/DsrF family n=1 Tax=Desulforhopalus singaporensis TaxID=91360 RepID=A0A1H0LDT9_9BACT|nr:DsrE family protein [Desulforhopalus singaporensis]SDO66394.1 Intracellular sulfur oxidation protein, DsrE/DsrF family [Desulforhopalus singaporensis]
MVRRMKYIVAVWCIFLLFPCLPSLGGEIDDSDALAGVGAAKIIFDINLNDANKLELYLGVIERTRNSLVDQGFDPDIVIAFRGASVRLVTTETWSFTEERQLSLKRSAQMLRELAGAGVKLEACSVAVELFKVDRKTILPEIKIVGNTFISLMGYQSKGYALVPIQ